MIEVVPVESVSGHKPGATCEFCEKIATKDVIFSFGGDPQYGIVCCENHINEAKKEEEHARNH